uniref:Piwi domain-containing protein n=1 Tax=Oncorhynchus mykiss TaxID=8022 RepID=A0A8C7R1S7_ONCMY
AQKILLQMNCKLGGELWTVNIPLFSIIIFTGKVGLPSGGTPVTFQMPNEEVINGIRVCLLAALQKYYIGEWARQDLSAFERDMVVGARCTSLCQELQRCWVSPGATISRPKGHPANLPLRTVLDHTVTNRDWVYFFYLMAHHIQQGCGLPTHYISVYNTANLSPDHFSKVRLTFKMCHMYWNWPWTIQVPVPYKYGLKLAYLSGKLYFLLSLSPPRRSTPVCTTMNRSQPSKP